MTFHEFPHGMTVMDGNRCVAKARFIPSGGWMLRTYNGCWSDPRARSQGLFPGKFPYLLHVGSKGEARSVLRGLALSC